ncbi:Nucleolar pre-ribosomal-associated protein [Lachnellula occidentalis]|uniref:Nucleolar pre-ribosomal-associated protein n=1 Tax=Lachnellula occidentalis TaxID=215460 RepID=A0A8H8RGY7_9HELO|nr:Nucleolar pre-ribosomal-associated protein [Lachnellula occidentalis]
MASQSHAAQEQLAKLEKASAPFGEQLLEAAKFIGVSIETVGRGARIEEGEEKKGKAAVYHGREEWLLRWLLKKLQNPKDAVPRQTPSSWWLFGHLVQSIPLPIAARLLIERKFTAILRQTLEEALKAADESNIANDRAISESSPAIEGESSRPSKKRKRSPELIAKSGGTAEFLDLMDAIYTTLYFITRSTKSTAAISEKGRDASFSAEYMRTAVKSPAQESATILGLWFSLSDVVLGARKESVESSWLSPFIEIWNARAADESELSFFSRHCLESLVLLLRATGKGISGNDDWTAQLEQLVARNVMIPAKAAKRDDPESSLLPNLARIPVVKNTANAPVLFDIAIRSIVSHGTQRRRPQDDAWLQHVFTTLQDALVNRREDNSEALCAMLQSARKYKVGIELSTLRNITSRFALPKGRNDWKLVQNLIALDANVFLIPDSEANLLDELFSRITKACIQSDWAEVADRVVLDVLVPLMNEFAKARDLPGFIRHWYAQLVEFEKLRIEAMLFSMELFSAWEDEALQTELSKLLEPSLTIQQINQVLDWLSTQLAENPNAVCVILQAISRSISREETVDSVNTRLYHIMFDDEASEKLDGRYKWRSWSILSETLSWVMEPGLEDLSVLWGPGSTKRTKRFGPLGNKVLSAGLLEVYSGTTVNLESLEILRCTCASWSAAKIGSNLAGLSRDLVIDLLERLARELKTFPRDLAVDFGMGRSICAGRQNTLYRDISWMMWALVRCIFVEYPKVLTLVPELSNDAPQELLQNILWVSSANAVESSQIDWLRLNPKAFPDLWTSALRNDCVLECPALISTMMNLMLDVDSNMKNPLIKSQSINNFAIRSLLNLPGELFSRENREQVLTSWLPVSGPLESKTPALEPVILALKTKLVRRSAFYEGMTFRDLINLADALAELKADSLHTSLALFKELVRLTLRLIALDDLGIIKTTEFQALCAELKEYLLTQLGVSLAGEFSPKKKVRKSLLLFCTIDALTSFGVTPSDLAGFKDAAISFASQPENTTFAVGKRLDVFMSIQAGEVGKSNFGTRVKGDLTTVYGREAIMAKVQAATSAKSEKSKLKLLDSIFGEGLVGLTQTDKLLAAQHVIMSCEDVRRSDEGEDENKLDLSMAYSILCGHLWKATEIRLFCIISEMMELMLRTKGRSMSQWNIDSTLGSITIICSRNGPTLPSNHSGAVYIHLCRLLQAVLTSHRLKIQGHFHLVVQVMQTLLRCLFLSLPHSTTKTTKFLAPPPWLTSSKHQLGAKHAEAFTRLVTSICDPSVSSVTRSQHNTLTSATDKAKRMAAQHMQFVLTTYIKLQLEMRMLPEIREKMVPGLYAIFNTTSPEMRRMISESLDASGRAVFGTLFRDYQRFGKWKGS